MFKSIGKNTTIYPLAKFIYPRNISIGDESVIDDFAFLYASGKGIEIGKFCHITVHCTLMAGGKITIKDFTGIGPNCVILAESDDYNGNGFIGLQVFGDKYRKRVELDVTFEKHVHVGAGSIILPGITLGEGCSIGAGSLVTKSMPAWTICFGSPCKPIKDKPKDKQLQMEKDFLKEYYGE
jgi:acetyltransferase-like isoleucine patch superfamily enzyme